MNELFAPGNKSEFTVLTCARDLLLSEGGETVLNAAAFENIGKTNRGRVHESGAVISRDKVSSVRKHGFMSSQ